MSGNPRRPETASEIALPWIIRLRYGMATGQVVTALFAQFFLHIDLPLNWLGLGPALVVLSNLWLARWLRNQSFRNVAISTAVNWVFLLDIACLTGMLLLSGGPTNPFSLLYLVHITLAATILTKRQTWLLGAVSSLCFGLLFWKYRPIPALETHSPGTGLNLHLMGMWAGFSVAAFLVAMFSAKISELLREREESLFKMQEELSKKDRLASLVTLAAGAAHELGTPLGTIALVSREIERYATKTSPDAAVAEDSRLIRQEVDRCRLILQRMSTDGAEPAGEALERVRAEDLIEGVRNQFAQTSVTLDSSPSPSMTELYIPRHAVQQALIALIQNALDASSVASQVHLQVAPGFRSVSFVVSDKGSGMSPEILRHVGEPFFTTKDPGKGMGLGTFLVQTLAERLGGSLRYESAPGVGTTATFELPFLVNAKPTTMEPVR